MIIDSTKVPMTQNHCYKQYGFNVLSLFDRMSCGQIALEKANIKINEYYDAEIDKYAIQVTQKNYPNTIQLGDIIKIKGSDLPKIDLLIGGSPCQGLSFAGKQLNFEDPRSKLFFKFVSKKGEKKRMPMWYYKALQEAKTPEQRRTLRSKTFQNITNTITQQYKNYIKNNYNVH